MSKETKKDRFRRLASHRTNEVLYRLKVLGNCANRQLYEYDEKEVTKIFSEVDQAVKDAKSKFHHTRRRSPFRL